MIKKIKKMIWFLIVIILSNASFDLNADTTQKIAGTFKDTVIIGALDKVTARTSKVTIKVGETVKIGTLMVKAVKAWVSNPEETPESKVYFEITEKKEKLYDVFRGWMFASNPSISALEHPVYDIWVIQVNGKQVDGNTHSSQIIDKDTSQRIDELIDQLIDQSANESDLIEESDIIDETDEKH